MAPKLSKVVDITNSAYFFLLIFLVVGCGTQYEKPNTPGESPTTEEQSLFAAAKTTGTATNGQVTTMQVKLQTIKSNAQACIQDPACLNQKIDQLFVSLSNLYLIHYTDVRIGLVGGVNANGKSGSGYSYRLLQNAGSGFALTQSVNQPIQAVPVNGKAALSAAILGSKVGLTPYAGAALLYVDQATGLIALAGADNEGYSYCYVAIGVAPLCYTAGW